MNHKLALATFALICGCLLAGNSTTAERPNIVLVFIDDMGWGNFS